MNKRKTLSKKKRFQVLERDKYTCQYCGATIDDGVKLEIDHIIPVSKGGKDGLCNLTTACFDCNRGKRDFLNIRDIKAIDITPEIANCYYPILKKIFLENIDSEKLSRENKEHNEFTLSDEYRCLVHEDKMKMFEEKKGDEMKQLEKNQEKICRFLSIDKDKFHEYLMRFQEQYDEYEKKTHIKLKSCKQHLDMYKKYHNLKSDTAVALKLISGCLIPENYAQSLLSFNSYKKSGVPPIV